MGWINSIAFRYFFSKKKDNLVNLASKIAIFASSFAICMLIISFSVIRGFEETITNKVLADQGHIIITGNAPFCPDFVMKNLPKGLRAEAVIETSGLIVKGEQVDTILLRGVDDEKLTNFKNAEKGVENGRKNGQNCEIIAKTEQNGVENQTEFQKKSYPIFIGAKMAKVLNLACGADFSFVVPIKSMPPFSIMPETISCKIEKIVQFNLHDLNRFGVFMRLSDAQKALNLHGKVSKIICFAKTPQEALKFIPELEKNLPTFNVYSWKNLNLLFADVMRIQRNMVSVILFAIVFLATIASASSLTLLIYMKKREISILRILGATKKNIVAIFLRIGMLISGISCGFGLIFGVLLAWNLDYIRRLIEFIFHKSLFDPNVYLLPAIPVSLNFWDIFTILGCSFIVSFLAAIIPAYKSASVDVLENLQ